MNILNHLSVKHFFMAVSLMASDMVTPAMSKEQDVEHVQPVSINRPITPAEADFAKSIFGADFDTHIFIMTQPLDKNKGYFADIIVEPVYGSDGKIEYYNQSIILNGDEFASDDYVLKSNEVLEGDDKSGVSNTDKLWVFMRGMTYLWTVQNGDEFVTKSINQQAYLIDRQSNFGSFNYNQQASILSDYCLRFRVEIPQPTYLHRNNRGNVPDTPTNDYLLRNVVEKFFPDAEQGRLKQQKEIQEKREKEKAELENQQGGAMKDTLTRPPVLSPKR